MNSDFRIVKSATKYYFQREFACGWCTLHKVEALVTTGILQCSSIEELIVYIDTADSDDINTEYYYHAHWHINDTITWMWTSEQMKTEFPEWFI